MGEVTFHPELMDPPQTAALERSGRLLTERGFRLAGGTGLALILGHRRSVDFDWFCEREMGDAMLLVGDLRDHGLDLQVEQVSRGTVHGTVAGVRISLLEFRYPALAPPIEWPDEGIEILSLDDIACMKLSAIAQRGARKDFVDLFALLDHHRPLAELIELYRRKFEIDEIGHLLYSLTYFKDAEGERMPEMLWSVDWNTMRTEIESRVKALAER
jgi:hypothetical protein